MPEREAGDDDSLPPAAVQVPQANRSAGSAPPVKRAEAAAQRFSRPIFVSLLAAGEIVSLTVGGGLGALAISGWRPALLVALLTGAALIITRHRRWRFTLSVLDDLPRIAGATGGATLAVASGVALFDRSWDTTERVLGTTLTGAVVFVGVVVGRVATYSVAHALRHRGIGAARAIIVGTGLAGSALGRVLANDRRYGVAFLGFVDDVPAPIDGRRLLGTLESLPNVVRDQRVDLVLVASSADGCHAAADSVRSIRPADCEVYVVPRFHEMHDRAVVTEMVNGIPLVRSRRLAFRSPSWRVKRALDVIAAGVGLILLAPLLVVLAIAVRIHAGPGVIVRQPRVGRDGRPFMLYNFHSLNPIDGDPRVGRIGSFIRSTGLDELPQLVNVLRGDMSLVGPRPERPYFVGQVEQTVPGHRHQLRMPAGLTGLAAVHGLSGVTGNHERANVDNIYAESWSLWLDVTILAKTTGQVLAPGRHRRLRRRKDALSP